MIRILLPLALIGLYMAAQYYFSLRHTRAMLARKSRPLEDLVLGKHLDRLADAAGVDAIRVRIFDVPMINGLATPDGEIYVTRGLYEKYLQRKISAAELASVIAHELGHVALGHSRRRMADITGARMVQVVLGTILARFLPFVGWWLAGWVASLFVARLSREDEFEADRFGAALMVKSGLGAEPQATMLEKLEELIPGMNGQPAAWLASHPPVEDRARRIRTAAEGWSRDAAPSLP